MGLDQSLSPTLLPRFTFFQAACAHGPAFCRRLRAAVRAQSGLQALGILPSFFSATSRAHLLSF
jgi:hypothetical protein